VKSRSPVDKQLVDSTSKSLNISKKPLPWDKITSLFLFYFLHSKKYLKCKNSLSCHDFARNKYNKITFEFIMCPKLF